MAMQRPLPFGSMTVLENAVLGAMFGGSDGIVAEREARKRAAESLAFVGLASRAEQPVSSLNLHQQRFLEMAKALAGRPKVLLLDEVMAGLNEAELAASVEIVRNVRDELGTTILWVEHVMSAVIQLAERVVVLNFGKAPGGGRARDRHAGSAGRRRVSRAGARCLRSRGWRPATSASGSSTASTSRCAPARRWRSSARTAPARRRSSGPSPGCSRRWQGGSCSTGRT